MNTTGIYTWEITGKELLDRPGQLIVANHPTLIDIVFLIAMLPNATCIVKSQLYRNPFTRGPVSRAAYVANNSADKLVSDCVDALASGTSLVVFPEGTRSERGVPGRFQRGAAYVLLDAKCPLVLATIEPKPLMLGNDLQEKIKVLIISSLELEDIAPSDIIADDPLFDEGLGLDSIDALELGMALQTEFGVSIDAEDESTREHFRSVTNLAKFVATQQSGM
ncbi:UNVERIFIED_CONTAM: hypothetical protein GTU68_035008 [Idotea baltica]|nr:hypothetical protein [Idotea baltica]